MRAGDWNEGRRAAFAYKESSLASRASSRPAQAEWYWCGGLARRSGRCGAVIPAVGFPPEPWTWPQVPGRPRRKVWLVALPLLARADGAPAGARVFAGKPLDRLAGPETGWTAGMRSACAIRREARLREPQARSRGIESLVSFAVPRER